MGVYEDLTNRYFFICRSVSMIIHVPILARDEINPVDSFSPQSATPSTDPATAGHFIPFACAVVG